MITLLAGPPYGKSLEQIGWFNRTQVQKLFLRYRDHQGLLNLEMIQAEGAALKQQVMLDSNALWREMRRRQAWPEWMIDRELEQRRRK